MTYISLIRAKLDSLRSRLNLKTLKSAACASIWGEGVVRISFVEIDMASVVTYVVDGDTFDVVSGERTRAPNSSPS